MATGWGDVTWEEVQRTTFWHEGLPHTTVELRSLNGDVRFVRELGVLPADTVAV